MARNDRNDKNEQSDGLVERLVTVDRVAKVVKGGRIFSFTALTAVVKRAKYQLLSKKL